MKTFTESDALTLHDAPINSIVDVAGLMIKVVPSTDCSPCVWLGERCPCCINGCCTSFNRPDKTSVAFERFEK